MVIADTGFWLALANADDQYHVQAVQRMRALFVRKERLITTCAVMAETCHLLLRDLGTNAQQQFIETYRANGFDLFELQPTHAARIADLMKKYANLPMDLADASLVVLAEHLGHGRILSSDKRDFQAYRWKNHHPFQNLLI
jgi:uncharacterized protein